MTPPRVLVSCRNPPKAGPHLDALRAVGIHPVLCTPTARPLTTDLQGLLLTGGSDVDPAFYDQSPQPDLGEVDQQRDAFELDLLTLADAARLPTLCICRGMQLLNVHRGGTLVQHLPQSDRHRRNDTPKSEPVHPVHIEPGSKLARILAATDVNVNSRHHQAVDRLGTDLLVTARDPHDQVIEAIEDPAHPFLLGVQWHPEDQSPHDQLQHRLFEAFRGEFRCTR